MTGSKISVKASSKSIKKFETLTLQIKLAQLFENPFNPDEIRVDALIQTPIEKTVILPCFYKSGESEKSQWEARFTAMHPGKHEIRIQSITKDDTLISDILSINVTDSDRDGFLRMNPNSKYSFLFDSGKRFRGVGLNIGWELEPKWGNEEMYSYENLLSELETNHGNFFRAWMCPWNLPLEWMQVNRFASYIDEFENWDQSFLHSDGLQLESGKTTFTEDDMERITIQSDSKQTLIWNVNDVKKFKLKIFYQTQFTPDDIQVFASPDNESYESVSIEFSQTWNTFEDWHRVFVATLGEIPDGMNYLKIQIQKPLDTSPHLAGISIGNGPPENAVDAPGLGRYYEKTANRLDEILQICEEKGIYLMLAHDYHGIFKPQLDRWGSNDEWRRNPYNTDNGGPCDMQTDFFTHPEAKRLYKSRLRYMVARWGHSTNLGCWEFWNEIDNAMDWQSIPETAVAAWHNEMADYLKSIDPYKHLVTTSVSHRETPLLWQVNGLEFTQRHNYGPTQDMEATIYDYIKSTGKPHVVGEFSLGWKGPGKDYPVELYEGELHNGLWRGMFAPGPILPMSWWWEWHYDQGHYFHFKPAADFVALMLKHNEDVIEPLQITSPDPDLVVRGLRTSDGLFFWMLNSGKTDLYDPRLQIEGAKNAVYLLRRFDTWTGEFSAEEKVHLDGQLILESVQIKASGDMALWLRAVEQN